MRISWAIAACVAACGLGGTGERALAAAAASIAPGTFAWDYRNGPVAAPLAGYEIVAISPRAIGSPAADSLRHAGTRLWVWLQPAWATWRSQPVRDHAFDRGVVRLAERFGATLTDSTGRRVTLGGEGPDASYVLDFSVPGFADTLAGHVASACAGADGVLLDYGCGTLAWLVPGVAPARWDAWRAGWLAFVDGLRRRRPDWRIVAQCDRMGPGLAVHVDGLFLEKAGMSLNPEGKVWDVLVGAVRADSARGAQGYVVRVEDRDARKRRYFAALALATGASFNACDLRGDFGGGTRDRSDRDPEHFELDLGPPVGPLRIVKADLIERRFARGFVVVNRGKKSIRHAGPDGRTRTLAAKDGLVAQTRDRAGRALPTHTTEAR